MSNKILLGAALLSVGALAWAAKDPVIMTVNGVDVPLSEFEYLYHKNSQQQLSPQPLPEYVEMFKNYKLKVADARSMGIDTTRAFAREMEQYKGELAAPFTADSVMLNQMVREAYDRSRREVEVSHIMLWQSPNRRADEAAYARLDSIRNAVLAGADFAEMAREFSVDGSASRGGSLGYIVANRFPYFFEEAAFSLKPGEVSKIVKSPKAYHIIKAGQSRPARGSVSVEHIMLRAPKNMLLDELNKVQARIDSIYQVVSADPSKFEELAGKFSEDPGSAQRGGRLPEFTSGMMVPEFEEESFRLADGEISKPVKTDYGFHIIRKLGHRPAPTLEELKPMVLQRAQHPQDERSQILRDAQTVKLAKKLHGKLNKQNIDAIANGMMTSGLDSTFYMAYSKAPLADMPLFSIGKRSYTMVEFLPMMRKLVQPDGIAAANTFRERLDRFYNSQLVDAELDWLEANEPDYRNLYHEYRDGSLLYEASVKNVWDKAANDVTGLEKYFADHRSDYTWSEPRAKGLLVQTKNDSVAGLVKEFNKNFSPALSNDSLARALRDKFKGEIKIDRVIAPKGVNAMVDRIMFNGSDTKPTASGFTDFFMLRERIIDAPEEMADVRPQVTSDYQNELEKQWIASLRARYPVVVNEKILKKVKPL